jgi:hypothetical protein
MRGAQAVLRGADGLRWVGAGARRLRSRSSRRFGLVIRWSRVRAARGGAGSGTATHPGQALSRLAGL